MAKTLNRNMIMVDPVNAVRRSRFSSWDYTLLGIALLIDFVDLLPFNLPGSALETLFLMYMGMPPVNSVVRGVIDLIPIVDWMPWCTLIVLHFRFGVNFGRFNAFLPGKSSEKGDHLHAGSPVAISGHGEKSGLARDYGQ